jgi:lipid-A-disaccharide synthase
MSNGPTVCLLAADVSGDRLAANLAHELRARVPNVRLLGAGGAAMVAAKVDVGVQLTQLSFTGVLDALHVSRELFRSFRAVQRMVLAARPDLVVLVDAEVVSLPFATWLRRRGIPAAFYFPPQTWLWGRWRMPFIVPLVRRVLSAFRDEAELYRRAGADTVWTGHPLADLVEVRDDPTAALVAAGLVPGRPLVVLMPGSRRTEIQRLGPPILEAAQRLQARDPRLQFALPLASEALRADVDEQLRRYPVRDLVVYQPDSYAILSQARAVIQSSGTATLETALLGVPSVITYRLRPIEYLFARWFMCVDYIGMANILLGEMVQPELFQKHVDAEHLCEAAWSLLTDEVRRRAVVRRLSELRAILGGPGAVARAAAAVIELLPEVAAAAEEVPALSSGHTRSAVSA